MSCYCSLARSWHQEWQLVRTSNGEHSLQLITTCFTDIAIRSLYCDSYHVLLSCFDCLYVCTKNTAVSFDFNDNEWHFFLMPHICVGRFVYNSEIYAHCMHTYMSYTIYGKTFKGETFVDFAAFYLSVKVFQHIFHNIVL